jgi:UrcA family protein
MATQKAFFTIAFFAGSLASIAPASADVRTMEVRVSDLDLSRPSAQIRLQERIDRAVRKVCRSNAAHNLAERQDVSRCETGAKAGAQAQMTQRIAEHKDLRKQLARAKLQLAAD